MLLLYCKDALELKGKGILINSKEYVFSASNSVSLSVAVDKIYEAELLGNNSLSPLNGQQLAIFPSLKDKCHWSGLACIPDYVICHEYYLDKT